MIRKSICFLSLLSLILISCGKDILDVDASEIKVNVEFVDVDSVYYHADSVELMKAHKQFKKQITDIYNYELGNSLGIGDVHDTAFYNSIQMFLRDPYIIRLEKRIQTEFENKRELKKTVLEGFRYLKYHFPNGKQPNNIVFLNTLFASNVFCTENEIGIGLERYLGDSTDVIKELPSDQIFDWIKKGMNRKFLERDVLAGWIMTHYVDPPEGNLAEQMITWGKILYLTQAAFPKMEKEIIMRYDKSELKWAKENEWAFWKYLVDEDLLFKIDELNTRNMLSEGPATLGLPEKGPDRMGQYLGWQMVLKYQEKKQLKLEDLVRLSYNEILQEYEIE